MYLDIIRRYRRDERDSPSVAAELPVGSSRGVASAPGPARAANGGSERPSTLRVEDVLAEISRPGSGPARALETYREKPNAERLCWLTKAILHVRGTSTDGWERCVPAVAEATKKLDEEDED